MVCLGYVWQFFDVYGHLHPFVRSLRSGTTSVSVCLSLSYDWCMYSFFYLGFNGAVDFKSMIFNDGLGTPQVYVPEMTKIQSMRNKLLNLEENSKNKKPQKKSIISKFVWMSGSKCVTSMYIKAHWPWLAHREFPNAVSSWNECWVCVSAEFVDVFTVVSICSLMKCIKKREKRCSKEDVIEASESDKMWRLTEALIVYGITHKIWQ